MDNPNNPLSMTPNRSWTQRISGWFGLSFLDRVEEVEPEDWKPEDTEALIEEISQWVVNRGLETPAILFIEAHRPFSVIANQALIAGTPMMAPLFGFGRMEQLSKLLETSENVDRLIDRIETLAHDRPKKAEAR